MLFLIGTPLNESEPLSPRAAAVVLRAAIVIAESRRVALPLFKRSGVAVDGKSVHFLDGISERARRDLRDVLIDAKKRSLDIALLSDCGMPCLFDPGNEILEEARQLGIPLRTIGGETSWGTACAASGYEPPFLLLGFLSQDARARAEELKQLKHSLTQSHVVLLDTPYRLERLIQELTRALGANAEIFVAWELGTDREQLYSGPLRGVRLTKGEFVLIVRRQIARQTSTRKLGRGRVQ